MSEWPAPVNDFRRVESDENGVVYEKDTSEATLEVIIDRRVSMLGTADWEVKHTPREEVLLGGYMGSYEDAREDAEERAKELMESMGEGWVEG